MILQAPKTALLDMEHIPLSNYTNDEKDNLLNLAKQSIENGLKFGRPLKVNLDDYSNKLTEQLATFVTLHKDEQLRGCIGSLIAHHPLVIDIAENAYSSAFSDPRFPQLKQEELNQLKIDISILTPPEPITFAGRANLLEQIRPGIDGLILSEGFNRGTFLPSVWESLPEKEEFLQNLFMKAGLKHNYWSDNIHVERYETICFGADFTS